MDSQPISTSAQSITVEPSKSETSDLILKSTSSIEVRQGNGKFIFEMNSRVESENEKGFLELADCFVKFINQLTRRQ